MHSECFRSDQFVIVGRFRVVWDWLSFEGLDAEEELCEVVKDAAGVRVVIFTGPSVLEIVVALVVEHLVGCQIHSGVEELRGKDKVSIVYVCDESDDAQICSRNFSP